jgi:ATP-dependent Lhr-like helicase
MTLAFVNTRSQAEMLFAALWDANEDALPIALHHGSLDVSQRRKVEAAMAAGKLRAVVCTSTLDLGIDWGDVDLVIHVGAPKGSSRLLQRIGRANHRLDVPSQAMLVPSNRFEVLECEAALEAAKENAQDSQPPLRIKLDVLAQHIFGRACAGPFDPDGLYAEVCRALSYRDLARADFDRAIDFVSTGGYALKTYERYAKLKLLPDGRLRLAHPQLAQRYRMNIGTIVEEEMLKVRLASVKRRLGKRIAVGGRVLGELEEYFLSTLTPGDTFLFAGEVLRFEGVAGTDAFVTRAPGEAPKVPSWNGGKFPLTTYLAERVRSMIRDRDSWPSLPEDLREWLETQREVSLIPQPDELLVETFPHANRYFLVCYPFDGRLAHQTLGMLLTRRLERQGLQPLGFVPTEYSLSIWGRRDLSGVDMAALFDEDMLGDDLEAWLHEAPLMKRTFANCAVIAGLVDRRQPGHEKTGRQVSFSADLIYDVLKEHEPNHVLLRAAWADAAGGYLDIARLSALLARVKGRIRHARLDRVSPLAIPVMLEINKETIYGEAQEAMLKEAADALILEGMRV